MCAFSLIFFTFIPGRNVCVKSVLKVTFGHFTHNIYVTLFTFSKMIRGHCVFWAVDTEVPFWAKKLPNDKLKKKMKERLQTLLFRYRGR